VRTGAVQREYRGWPIRQSWSG